MPLPLERLCETCPIRGACTDEEDIRFVLTSISQRNRGIITDNEFEFGLTSQQFKAQEECQAAKYKTEDCAFTTADDLAQR